MVNKYLPAAFEKWKSFVNKFTEMEKLRANVTAIKYADSYVFEIENFNGKKFKTGLKLFDNPDSLYPDYCTYSLNTHGLPIIEDTKHVHNKMSWSAYYLYEQNDTIYVHYNHVDFLPERLSWIQWEHGKKRTKHSFGFQYKADAYIDKLPDEIIKEAYTNKKFPLFWSVEVFNYDKTDKKIISADRMTYSSGWGFYKSLKYYTYDDDGKLSKIEAVNDTIGNTQVTTIEYSRPPKGETLTSLTTILAEGFTNIIIEGLLKEAINSPIVLLDMSYRSVTDYIPYVEYATEKDLTAFENSSIHDPSEKFYGATWMKHKMDLDISEEMKASYARLMERIDCTNNWPAGEKMLHLTSKKINKKAKFLSQDRFSKEFFAYALDYEIDRDLEKTFFKCGASRTQIREWKLAGEL